jgi:hypothetical protein
MSRWSSTIATFITEGRGVGGVLLNVRLETLIS